MHPSILVLGGLLVEPREEGVHRPHDRGVAGERADDVGHARSL